MAHLHLIESLEHGMSSLQEVRMSQSAEGWQLLGSRLTAQLPARCALLGKGWASAVWSCHSMWQKVTKEVITPVLPQQSLCQLVLAMAAMLKLKNVLSYLWLTPAVIWMSKCGMWAEKHHEKNIHCPGWYYSWVCTYCTALYSSPCF